MKQDLRNVKWDIKKGYGMYRSIYTPQLVSWIRGGQIKRGEVLVWRSGFSGFRLPEQVEELAPFFRVYKRLQPKRLKATKPLRKISPRKRLIHKILIIDDEKKITWLLGDILKDKGYEVETADTAKQGMRVAREQRPDLVFLDLRLPDRTGINLLKPLRRLPSYPLICVISAYGNEEVRRTARYNGTFRFIDKPFTAQKILRVIKSVTR